jgi:hypothetical protein
MTIAKCSLRMAENTGSDEKNAFKQPAIKNKSTQRRLK